MLGTTMSSVSGLMSLRTRSDGPNRTTSMSRYSSIDSISSRRLTKCSWLFISRRSSTDSFWISIRAVSGCVRMRDEIEVSVLKRKCGLIWLLSASILAAMSSVSCSCSRCSMRALFQILIGVATASTVARTTSTVMPIEGEPRKNSRCAPKRAPSAWRTSSSATAASSSTSGQLVSSRRTIFHTCLGRSTNTNGLNCQITSFGHASRSPPPANPQPTANGMAANSPAMQRGHADQEADQRAGVGAGDQSREERALERQVGGVVVEQRAERDARHQRHRDRQREHQPVESSRAARR